MRTNSVVPGFIKVNSLYHQITRTPPHVLQLMHSSNWEVLEVSPRYNLVLRAREKLDVSCLSRTKRERGECRRGSIVACARAQRCIWHLEVTYWRKMCGPARASMSESFPKLTSRRVGWTILLQNIRKRHWKNMAIAFQASRLLNPTFRPRLICPKALPYAAISLPLC